MLRTECLPGLANACLILTPRLLVIGLGVVATGCSADISRFDAPMFGLTESDNRVASAPIPREGVLSNGAQSTRYGGTYNSAPSYPVTVASLPEARSQPIYDEPYSPGRPSYSRPSQDAYRQTPAYEPSRGQPAAVAALPPSAAADSNRPLPWSEGPAPDRNESRPAFRSGSGSGAGGNAREVEVQPGDTLYSLAQRNGASISELMSLNGLRSPVVHPGQRIMLPDRPTAMAAAVRRAPEHGKETTRVAAFNQADPPEAGSIGHAAAAKEVPEPRPAVPAGTPQQAAESATGPGETYTMRNGESLYGIAVRHRVPLAELQRINNITDPHKVRAGTILKLPPATATAVASQPTAPLHTAAAPAEGAVGGMIKPVIVNAPASAPGQRVAALDSTGTRTDAAPRPLTLQPDAPAAAMEPEKASSSQGSGEVKADAGAKFRWPVRGKVVTNFGDQPDGSHSDGIKLAVPVGTEVHAAESGVVAYAGNELKGYGNLVLLRHDNGWITAYAHNDELSVKRGDRVRRGQVIAKAGNTGSIDKPQLHFELRKGSSPVDPIPYLEKL